MNPPTSQLHRRQFVLGPREAEGLESWPRRRVGPLHLASHPDLGVHAARAGDASLTLLGYVLDPERPDAGDREVLEDWAARWASGEEISRVVHAAAGRFALVARRPGSHVLLHDAAGLRTVVHAADDGAGLWCASDTPILAAQLGLREDPRRRRLWVDATDRSIVWFPLRETRYAEIRALIPNHWLDLETGEQQRFWPSRAIEPRGLEEAADEAASRLHAIVEAAARRFPLALGLTAGTDTRMLLAALRERRDEVFYFTFCRFPDQHEVRDDVRIPAEILGRFGLRHHVLACDAPDDPVLRAEFEASHAAPSETRWEEVLDLRRRLPAGHVRVSGHVGAAALATMLPRVDANLHRLAQRYHPDGVREAKRCLQPWWEAARELSQRTGYAVRDLYYWESRMGRWAAASQNQYDFACETVSPYACRALLEGLLSVDESQRSKRYGSPLAAAIVRRLWPELAEYAVNPGKAREREDRREQLARRRIRRWWRARTRAFWDRVHG